MNIVNAQCNRNDPGRLYYSVMMLCSKCYHHSVYMPSTEKSAVLICPMSIINIAVPSGGFIIHAKGVCT